MVKCKICNKQYKDIDFLVAHIEKEHSSQIPEDYTPARYEYQLRTGRTSGTCVVCKEPTGWNEHTNKYHRFCKNPKCKEEYREIFKKRMIDKHGKVHLLNDPDQQRKMIASKKTSGTYVWSDDSVKVSYASSYELDFLKMLDLFMNHPGDDIMGPSPHTYYYKYEGQTKFYIPDFYIPSLNLEIEIKDGLSNPNMHGKIQAVDKVKEKLKDEVMHKLSKSINYLKVVDMQYGEFFKVFLQLREKDDTHKDNKTISTLTEADIINHGKNLYVPKAPSYITPVLNYTKFNNDILRSVKNSKLNELDIIERDINSSIEYLDKVIKSSPTDEIHRMKAEAIKQKDFLNYKVKPILDKKKVQKQLMESHLEYHHREIIMESELDPTKNVYRPVYILLTYTGTSFSKLIKNTTHQPYSHSSISFDSSMDNLYSFGRKEVGDKMHFIEESIHAGLMGQVANTTKYSLYVFMATQKQYETIQMVLENMKANAEKYKYNTLGIITNFLGIESEREYSYFCSEFVADLLKKADENLVYKHPSLFTPSDLRKLPKTIFVNKGILSKYNQRYIDSIIQDKMLERGIHEC